MTDNIIREIKKIRIKFELNPAKNQAFLNLLYIIRKVANKNRDYSHKLWQLLKNEAVLQSITKDRKINYNEINTHLSDLNFDYIGEIIQDVKKIESELKAKSFVWYKVIPSEQNNFETLINEIENRNEIIPADIKNSKNGITPGTRSVEFILKEKNSILMRKTKTTSWMVKRDPNPYIRRNSAIEMLRWFPRNSIRDLIKLFENEGKVWSEVKGGFFQSKNFGFIGNDEYSASKTQQKFVKKALKTYDFAFLDGPPGSGKTRTICEIIIQKIEKNKRVLLVASTHIAVDNVLEKLSDSNPDLHAIRIGKSNKIDEKLLKFQLDNKVENIRENAINFLNKTEINAKLTPAQETFKNWINTSKSDEVKEIFENLVVDSANLICGTTIGILNYPKLKKLEQRLSLTESELFDIMILDEASKTTLPEFFVPAVFAKRWIIVGDYRQLTPYVGNEEISMLLDKLPRFYQEILYATYKISKDPEKTALIVTKKEIDRNFIISRCTALNILCYDIDQKEITNKALLKDLSQFDGLEVQNFANVIYGTLKSIVNIADSIYTLDYILYDKTMNIKIPQEISNKIIFKKIYNLNPKNPLRIEDGGIQLKNTSSFNEAIDKIKNPNQKSWLNEISYKISIFYEVCISSSFGKSKREEDNEQKNISMIDRYLEDILTLINLDKASIKPKKVNKELDNSKKEEKVDTQRKSDLAYKNLWKKYTKTRLSIQYIVQFWVPSVLSTLLFGQNESIKKLNWKESKLPKSKYFTGFLTSNKNSIPDSRYELLKYQNRMEPEISKFPREYFYENYGLNDDKMINSRKKLDLSEVFNSNLRFCDHNYGSNKFEDYEINLTEIKMIIFDFINLLKYIERKGIKEKYQIAILTYYGNQEKLIRQIMKELYDTHGIHPIYFKKYPIELEICTVDRFQGHEADIVFLSLVRQHKTGFLFSLNRLNVALTRAKYYLRVYTNSKFIKRRKDNLRLLYDFWSHCKEKKLITIMGNIDEDLKDLSLNTYNLINSYKPKIGIHFRKNIKT